MIGVKPDRTGEDVKDADGDEDELGPDAPFAVDQLEGPGSACEEACREREREDLPGVSMRTNDMAVGVTLEWDTPLVVVLLTPYPSQE